MKKYGIDWRLRIDGHKSDLYLGHYPVVRETPTGVWVHKYAAHGEPRPKWISKMALKGDPTKHKFIPNNSRRKFAHETEEEAYKAFMARKYRQLKILQCQIEDVLGTLYRLKESTRGYTRIPKDIRRWIEANGKIVDLF